MGSFFVMLMVPIICLPSVVGNDLDPAGMNWTCLVYGGPMLGAMVWWVMDARKWFKGPKINVDHVMLGREEQRAELQAEDEDGERLEGKNLSGEVRSVVSKDAPGDAQGDVKS